MTRASRIALALLFLAGTLLPALPNRSLAHEGQYRGPLDELRIPFRGSNSRLRPPLPPQGGTPPESTPGGSGEGSGTRRRVPPVGEDGQGFLRWEFWWEHNKDLFLALRNLENRENAVIVGGPDYLLGGVVRDRIPVVTPLDEALVKEALLPSLLRGTTDSDADVRAACWIALGKVATGVEPSAFERGMGDSNSDVQKAASIGLGLLGRPEGIPALLGMLRNPGRATKARLGAAVGLGLMEAPEVTPLLLGFLRTTLGSTGRNAEEVAIATIVALGIHGDPEAAAPLREIAQKGTGISDRVRAFTLGALGRLGDRESVPLLLRSLRESDLDIRRAAAIALGEIDLRSASEEVLAGLVERRSAWKSDASVSAEALAELDARIEKAKNEADAERKAMDKLRDGIARELARAVREDGDVQVRNYACISLGQNRGAGARETLLWALETGYSISLNGFAALGLGLLGDPSSSPALLERLASHDSKNVRGAFAIALGLLDEKAAIPILTSIVLYKGLDSDLRGYAAIALGLIGDRDLVPDLQRMLAEEKNDTDLLRGFSLALGLLGDRGSLEVLGKVLSGRNTKEVRGAACMAFGFIRDRESVGPLVGWLGGRSDGGRGSESMTRGFAAIGLGYVGDSDVVPKLSAIARNHDYRVFLQGYDDLLLIL